MSGMRWETHKRNARPPKVPGFAGLGSLGFRAHDLTQSPITHIPGRSGSGTKWSVGFQGPNPQTLKSLNAKLGFGVKGLAQRVHVGIWYILRAQRGSHIPTLRPKHIPCTYMDPVG